MWTSTKAADCNILTIGPIYSAVVEVR